MIKTKWNYLQKIIKGPASLSLARDRNVLHEVLDYIQNLLIKIKDIFCQSKYHSDCKIFDKIDFYDTAIKIG